MVPQADEYFQHLALDLASLETNPGLWDISSSVAIKLGTPYAALSHVGRECLFPR